MAEVRWRRAECDGGGRGARWEATCKAWHASPCPLERRRVLRAWRGSSLVHAGRLDVNWWPQGSERARGDGRPGIFRNSASGVSNLVERFEGDFASERS